MNAYLDATVLIGLGTIGELDRLTALDAELLVLPVVEAEVTTEPAQAALERVLDGGPLQPGPTPPHSGLEQAAEILDDPVDSADVHLIAAVLDDLDSGGAVGVISDDRRVRTVARGLGASVTGAIGVLVRNVDTGLDPETAKQLVRRLDRYGLHMTAELRDRAFELIEEAG